MWAISPGCSFSTVSSARGRTSLLTEESAWVLDGADGEAKKKSSAQEQHVNYIFLDTPQSSSTTLPQPFVGRLKESR